ncbi:M14 family zinc carboxypeptidase [Ignavibacterium sp.]|uniref:M14 family zinc carboxypeptidase n=1 Tax=Ignavibacterium sp. TaxID=2651167 RepID=UPI00307EE8C9
MSIIKIILTILFSLLISDTFAQTLPLELNNFQTVTSHKQLSSIVKELDSKSEIINVEEIGKSVEGREIFAVKFSKDGFNDKSKLKVLFFAQQHGNEQSGKEGALILAKELIKNENKFLFDRIDFALIPQVNPDGSELNKRRNSNGLDLNRNHLLIEEPEVQAVHNFFAKYNFDVTLDVHEYYPYSEEWKEFGYYKRADEQLGILTNPNISEKIIKYSKEKVLPFISEWLHSRNFSFNEYVVGGPPNIERLRHSTVDINDGRQSFGMLNTLSFILEGKNGKDYYVENIKHRSEAQSQAMLALLFFCYKNYDEINKLIEHERKEILSDNSPVVVQMDHFNDGSKFNLPVTSVSDEKDTVIQVDNYNPLVKKLLEIPQPDAYLVPKASSLSVGFMNNHKIFYHDQTPELGNVEIYNITKIDSIELEGEKFGNPELSIVEKKITDIDAEKYYIVPLNQPKRKILVLAFEPQSMLGLRNYEKFKKLLQAGFDYPIFRYIKD